MSTQDSIDCGSVAARSLQEFLDGPTGTLLPGEVREAARLFFSAIEADGCRTPRFVPMLTQGRNGILPALTAVWVVGARELVVSLTGLAEDRRNRSLRHPVFAYVLRRRIGPMLRHAGDGEHAEGGWIPAARQVVDWVHGGRAVASHDRIDNLKGLCRKGWG